MQRPDIKQKINSKYIRKVRGVSLTAVFPSFGNKSVSRHFLDGFPSYRKSAVNKHVLDICPLKALDLDGCRPRGLPDVREGRQPIFNFDGFTSRSKSDVNLYLIEGCVVSTNIREPVNQRAIDGCSSEGTIVPSTDILRLYVKEQELRQPDIFLTDIFVNGQKSAVNRRVIDGRPSRRNTPVNRRFLDGCRPRGRGAVTRYISH